LIKKALNKKLICIFLFIILFSFSLSGCTEIDINTGIDSDFTAYLSYRITLDASDIDRSYQNSLKRALNEIGWYYQEELGFIVELHIDSDPYVLIMTRRVANNSFEDAFESLKNMLTDEDMTLFTMVDMELRGFERQNRYLINAALDLPQIFRLSNAGELTPSLKEHLEKALETGEGTITLDLPAGELISSSHRATVQNNRVTMVTPLSYTDETSFELTAVVNLLRNGSPGGLLNEIIRELTMFRSLSIIICSAVIVVLFILILVVMLIRKRRLDESKIP